MMHYSSLGILMLPLLQAVLSQQSDKYTDENRPYKFGFNIDGYQHRKEEKNDKGIIKGEYGFITADGYYRVTKYETDENGRFKIISMKNYYVGFPPENPTTTPPSISEHIGRPKKVKTTIEQLARPFAGKIVDSEFSRDEFRTSSTTVRSERRTTSNLTPTTRRFNIFQGQSGCSHCIIPTTSKPSTSNSNQYSVDYRVGINNQFETETTTTKQIKIDERQKNEALNPPENPSIRRNDPAFKHSINDSENDINRPNHKTNDLNVLKKHFPFQNSDSDLGEINPNIDPEDEKYADLPKLQDLFKSTNFSKSTQKPRKSKLVEKVKQINDNNSNNFRADVNNDPNESLTKDKSKLLYTFNYTLGFHGHHENGFRNGDKEGDYFFDGKDGTKRNVTYIANEFGYQPNITLTDLNQDEIRRFNENNENDHGLKGYEFKWFYTRRK